MKTRAYELGSEKLQTDDAQQRGYDSPKLFHTDTLLRIRALASQVREEMSFIQMLKHQLRKAEWRRDSLKNSVAKNPILSADDDTMMANLKVGARVKVIRAHWLRAGQTGTVIAAKETGINHWLVEFPETCEGGGIDGNKLWLNEVQLRLQKGKYAQLATFSHA